MVFESTLEPEILNSTGQDFELMTKKLESMAEADCPYVGVQDAIRLYNANKENLHVDNKYPSV
jgi:hypothetical protein